MARESSSGSYPDLKGVAVDLRGAAQRISGIERFALNLVQGLAERQDTGELSLLLAPGQDVPFAHPFRTIERPPPGPRPWRQKAELRALTDQGIGLVTSPDIFAPLPFLAGAGPRQIVTLHDVTPLRIPEHLKGAKKAKFRGLWRLWLGLQIRYAWRVLTVSEHARGDIIDLFPTASAKLRVVPNAVVAMACGPLVARDARPFRLLFVGRADGNKNLEGCVRLLDGLVEQGVDAHLRIIGSPDPRYNEADRLIQELDLSDRIQRDGYVTEADLDRAYHDADLFVFLSRYEGFGLPPLEAMARGLPVLASNRASLPEVLGNAALLVDPTDNAAALAAALRVRREPGLQSALRERGIARAGMFTLDRQAEAFVSAIS